jgi:hypothetical protein
MAWSAAPPPPAATPAPPPPPPLGLGSIGRRRRTCPALGLGRHLIVRAFLIRGRDGRILLVSGRRLSQMRNI